MAILTGIGAKLGNMTLEQYLTADVSSKWNEYDGIVVDGGGFRNEKAEYSYIALEPQISIEYAFTGFFMMRVCGSYILPFDNPLVRNAWTVNGNNAYANVPKGVKPQGFQMSFGIYLGLFNY
jgi:hypothetical protein